MSVFNPIWSSDDSPELAKAIGDVVLAWTQAEFDQACLLAAMLDIPVNKASRIYQKFPNFRSRTQALRTLIELNPEFSDLDPFILKFSKLSKCRNSYVHGSFIRRMGGTELRAIDLNEPSESKKRSKPTKPNDIHQHADAVRRTCEEFRIAGETCKAYKSWLGPHPIPK